MKNKAKIFMIFGVSLLILTLIGSTFAYYVWRSSDEEETKIVTSVGTATIYFNGGASIEGASLRPVSNKSKGIVKTIDMKANVSGVNANLYLDVINIDDGLKDVSFKYEFYKGATLLKQGSFTEDYLISELKDCTKETGVKHIELAKESSVSTSVVTYTLYIWIDGANYDNPATMMNKKFSFKVHADGTGAMLKEGKIPGTPDNNNTLANNIVTMYLNSTKTEVINQLIYYYDTEHSLSNDVDGNVRYYGANPNNYIYFNCSDYSNQSSSTCETWRIIGVFNGKLKLIRNESIGKYSWDNKNTSTGAESNYGKNDWTTARLMKLLNPSDYYEVDSNDNNLGQSLYYNSTSGKCYSGENNATVDCDFTSTGIKNDTTRNLISEETWNMGGCYSLELYSNQIYGYERGTKVYSNRPTTWTGKIALAYPSDYGYAVDLNQCVNKQLDKYNDSTCTSNNWMRAIITNNGDNSGWLLTPRSDASDSVWNVYSDGHVNYNSYVYPASGGTPVLSLVSDLAMESGDGSSSSPYQLAV